MHKKSVAILTGPDTYLDHLSVICYLMDMPLLVTEEETYQAALEFYPQVRVVKKEMGELSFPFLASHFDVIFESGRFWAAELEPLLRLLCKKNIRFVYCPHGNSDKGHSAKVHVDQDISLFYGQHMLDLLTKTGAVRQIRTLIRTGNSRLLFYQEHKAFYQQLVQKHVLGQLQEGKKTVLYAPTWQDGENPSSFFAEAKRVIEELKREFNVVVKMHPFLEALQPAHTHRILGLYEGEPGVIFLHRYPAIYSLLEVCDLYIGDYSSIGYDFLFFNRPLYFFAGDESVSQSSLLHSCGMIIPSSIRLDEFICNTAKENQKEKEHKRKEVFIHAFGEEKPFSVLRNEIDQVIGAEKEPVE